MKTQKFYIEGMTCSACSGGIERSLRRKDFIDSIEVNLVNKTALVVFDENKGNLESIFNLIEKLGYAPHLQYASDEHQTTIQLLKEKKFEAVERKIISPLVRVCLALAIMFIMLYVSMVGMFFPALLPSAFDSFSVNITVQIIATCLIMLLGWRFYVKGFKSLYCKNPNMDSLIAISTIAAFIYSVYLLAENFSAHHLYFESIAVILALVMLGKTVEERAKEDSHDTLSALLAQQPKEAILINGNEERKILVDFIKVGDRLKILPGDCIPVDGVLAEGEGYLNESMLTGEVMPVYKKQGDKIFAGSLSTHTSFIMKVTDDSAHSTLQGIVKLIEQAAASKTKMTRIADKVASIFVPSVIVIAFIAGIFWTFYENFSFGFEIFIAVLVISCPCALGLATPMAVMIGSTLAHKKGLFFRNVGLMEKLQDIDCVVFDKTGTLTYNSLEVVEIVPFNNNHADNILQIAASIEQGSEHLIAHAIINEAQKKNLHLLNAQKFHTFAGYGISAFIDEKEYFVGNEDFFTKNAEPLRDERGLITVFVGTKDTILGLIFLEDRVKNRAKEIFDFFKSRHIQSLIVSGDRKESVQRVAHIVGVKDFIAHAKPKDKLDLINKLKSQNKTVMMVGDGINDVAALEASDVSVSFSNASDINYQSAGMIICNEAIDSIVYAMELSKAIVRNIKQNLFWAFCYNVMAIPIACGILYSYGIFLNPMLSALAMSLSSLSVVLNAQTLRKFKYKMAD